MRTWKKLWQQDDAERSRIFKSAEYTCPMSFDPTLDGKAVDQIYEAYRNGKQLLPPGPTEIKYYMDLSEQDEALAQQTKKWLLLRKDLVEAYRLIQSRSHEDRKQHAFGKNKTAFALIGQPGIGESNKML